MAVHLFSVVASVPLIAMGASAAFRHERRGVVAALLWLVYGASFLAHDMLSVNAELVLLLPAAWAIALVADERRATRAWPLVAAGLLIGLATLAKHPAAFWLPALAWAAVRARPDERSWRPADGLPPGAAASNVSRVTALWRASALAAGFALPLGGTWAWFAATGGAHDVAYWLLWRNAVYAANPISLGGALGRGARYLLPVAAGHRPLVVGVVARPARARPAPSPPDRRARLARSPADVCGLPFLPPLLRAGRVRLVAGRRAGCRALDGAAGPARGARLSRLDGRARRGLRRRERVAVARRGRRLPGERPGLPEGGRAAGGRRVLRSGQPALRVGMGAGVLLRGRSAGRTTGLALLRPRGGRHSPPTSPATPTAHGGASRTRPRPRPPTGTC